MSNQERVTIDFHADWVQFMREELVTADYPIAADNPQHISFKYFNVLKRRIEPRPRKVLIAEEFACPSDLTTSLNTLKVKFAKGEDLTPYLSKKILDADFNDPLLNDWGIHHFHLGSNETSSSFVERTGLLLFARVTADSAFFIDVMSHNSFSKKQLIEILHKNWPDSLQPYRLHGILPSQLQMQDDEIKSSRKCGLQTLIGIPDGTVYAPIGGGYTTAGIAIDVVRDSDHYFRRVRQFQSHVEEHLDELTSKIREQSQTPANPPRFRLVVSEEGAYALEESSRVAFFLSEL